MELAVIVVPVACTMLVIEWLRPRRHVQSPRWYMRALTLSALQVVCVYLGAATWERWLPVPTWSGQIAPGWDVLAGYLAVTFIYYWWHRARHAVPLLWRGLHQLHHSPVRLEVLTSFYKHPAEVLINGLLSSLLLTSLVGLSPTAASLTVAVTAIAEFFYHWNVRTPYWLGFLIQRPEMHCVHHELGVHTSNFSDLPLWDALFGTWRNPRTRAIACGFAEQRELQLWAMLSGHDVNAADRVTEAHAKPQTTPADTSAVTS